MAYKHFAVLGQLDKHSVGVRVQFRQAQMGGNRGLLVETDGRSESPFGGCAV